MCDLLKFSLPPLSQQSSKTLGLCLNLEILSLLSFFSMEQTVANISAGTVSQSLLLSLYIFYLYPVKLFCLDDFPLKLEPSQML